MKKLFQFLAHRVVIVAVLMIIQITLLIGMVWQFNNYFVFFYGFTVLLGAIIVLHILNGRSNPAYKISWIVPILLQPVFGTMLYIIFSNVRIGKKNIAKMHNIKNKAALSLRDVSKYEDICVKNPIAGSQTHYIENAALVPAFDNTYSEYLTMGEISFEKMIIELEKAEKYIFMEYFIIEEGLMWNTILEILISKAASGVDVRLIYDDLGCIFTLPYKYDKKLASMGIKCLVFNPFKPILSSNFNNRSHRKMTVIDGQAAFTGGINLADEYINTFEKHGHWKDTTILIKGSAVWGLTVIFLSLWEYLNGEEKDYNFYKPAKYPRLETSGYIQPYSDSPLDEELVGENICLNLINKAQRYVYITTPYLIIDNELMVALTTAAKSGIDVEIITPHVADKWYVHAVTKSNYQQLIESGVKIYEYTPGFIHAKSFVVDDLYGTVGTVNLDYRSFYLHYECGVWLYETDSLKQIREDFFNTVKLSQLITLEECKNVPWYVKFGRSLLNVFAPLM